MENLGTFTAAYIEAIYFSDTGDTDQPENDAELSDESRLDIEADCRSFWRRYGCYVITDVCSEAFSDSVAQAGHDFHFTRNGHGVGFWVNEWPKADRDLLTKGAEAYGELNVYLDDNGEISVA